MREEGMGHLKHRDVILNSVPVVTGMDGDVPDQTTLLESAFIEEAVLTGHNHEAGSVEPAKPKRDSVKMKGVTRAGSQLTRRRSERHRR